MFVFSLDFEPRQLQSSAPSVPLRKRAAGVSLINPGSKKYIQRLFVAVENRLDFIRLPTEPRTLWCLDRKVKATGVAFDDEED